MFQFLGWFFFFFFFFALIQYLEYNLSISEKLLLNKKFSLKRQRRCYLQLLPLNFVYFETLLLAFRLYLPLFVGGFMSYLRYLYLVEGPDGSMS